MGNVLARLRTPPSETYTKVTFPEGFTFARSPRASTDDMSDDDGGRRSCWRRPPTPGSRSVFRPPGITSLEGLLFPDTYQVSNGETPAQVLERMVAQMERVLATRRTSIIARSGGRGKVHDITPYQILIVASMIEREAKTDAGPARRSPA